MRKQISYLILSATVILAVIIVTQAYKSKFKKTETIVVTGLASRDFNSDLIVWKGNFVRKNVDIKLAAKDLLEDRDKIKTYLVGKGLKESEIVFSQVNIEKDFEYKTDKNGASTPVFKGYLLRQDLSVESKAVEKVEVIAREVSDLINQGIEFYSINPEYYYTKLASLKIEMIAEATKDGKVRAEKIAENADADIDHLRNASMGIFQIIAQNSSEEYSYGGAFNTSAKRKTANVTIRLEFGVE